MARASTAAAPATIWPGASIGGDAMSSKRSRHVGGGGGVRTGSVTMLPLD
jgi:hypothetical protein